MIQRSVFRAYKHDQHWHMSPVSRSKSPENTLQVFRSIIQYNSCQVYMRQQALGIPRRWRSQSSFWLWRACTDGVTITIDTTRHPTVSLSFIVLSCERICVTILGQRGVATTEFLCDVTRTSLGLGIVNTNIARFSRCSSSLASHKEFVKYNDLYSKLTSFTTKVICFLPLVDMPTVVDIGKCPNSGQFNTRKQGVHWACIRTVILELKLSKLLVVVKFMTLLLSIKAANCTSTRNKHNLFPQTFGFHSY